MKVKFQDPEFSFQLLRVLGSAASRQADVGEALAIADRIIEGDFESWFREWSTVAARLEAVADANRAAGRRVSASDTYLRAGNYYRAAEFYLHGDSHDPRIAEFSGRSLRCFHAALETGELAYELSAIPYEGTTLPGVFFSGGSGKRRTLIVQTGFDGTMSGMLPWALAATRRGWHCLTFEGPGQGEVIRKQGLPFRPDWEKVVGPVVDFLAARPEVDARRIALLGSSFGGFLAPRAAAYEPRLVACVANGGVMDFLGARIPKTMTREQFAHALKQNPDRINSAMREQAARSPQARWSQENGQYTFHAASPAEWCLKALDYDMTPHAANIRCATLIIDVENENSFPGQARPLYEALTCPKTWLYFSEAEGAGDHCQTGSPGLAQQRIFDWLDETVPA